MVFFYFYAALLASRSPFFRNVLEKRRRNYPEIIQLDEAVIPRIYARAILHAIYTDILDTTLIPNIPQSSLADANALANSERSNLPTHVRHAIDLYQIARFDLVLCFYIFFPDSFRKNKLTRDL